MTEALKNNIEKSNAGENEKTEYPPFNPEAAQEARNQRIKDVEKARRMAEAERPYREALIDINNAIKERQTHHSVYLPEQQQENFRQSVSRGNEQIRADQEMFKKLGVEKDFEDMAKGAAEAAKRVAEKEGEEAGKRYDRTH